ncbi:hypothetical protein ACJ4V0_13800 [Phreatobacter sp. HK31-P]
MNRIKTLAIAALAVATLSVGISSQAEAGPWHRRHIGWGVGALATGLIVGGAIASSRAHAGYGYASDCYLTRRWVDTPYGLRRQTVRICD